MHRSFDKIRQFLPVSVVALSLAACASTATQQTQEVTVDSMLRVADMTRSGGDLVNAVGLYQRAHELAPQDERPLVALGQVFAQLGSPASAAEAYRAAVAAAPSDVEARRGLGTALITMGQPEAAIIELEKALDIAKDYRIFNSLGVAYDMTGDHASAQTYYKTGLTLSPGNAELTNNLGLSLALDGQYPEAIALLEKISSDPAAPSRYRQNLALALGLAGNRDKAREVAQQDMDYATAEKNLSYFDVLKGLGDHRTMAAALGVHMAGSVSPMPMPSSPALAAPVAAAPAEPVTMIAPTVEPTIAAPAMVEPAAIEPAMIEEEVESEPLPPISELEADPVPTDLSAGRARSPEVIVMPSPAAGSAIETAPLPAADIDAEPLSEPRSERAETEIESPATGSGPARFDEIEPAADDGMERRPAGLSHLLDPPHEAMLVTYARMRELAARAVADPVIEVLAYLAAGPSATDFTGTGLYDPSGFEASRFARYY